MSTPYAHPLTRIFATQKLRMTRTTKSTVDQAWYSTITEYAIMSALFPSLAQPGRAFPLPSIAEDTLHYTLHFAPSNTDAAALAVLVSEYVESLLIQPWLWNKDAWELKPVRTEAGRGQSTCSKLEGRMRVGDAVDDEWIVVWLLREVSKKWNDLVISFVSHFSPDLTVPWPQSQTWS